MKENCPKCGAYCPGKDECETCGPFLQTQTREEELRLDLYIKTCRLMEMEEKMAEVREQFVTAMGNHRIALKLYYEERRKT